MAMMRSAPVTLVSYDPAGDPRGTVVLMHGFTRSPRDLQGLAMRAVNRGAKALIPHLGAWWWPRSTNNARYLSRIAEAVERQRSPGPVVIVGHSAGAPAGAWVAARLVDAGVDVSILVLVDGVESPARTLRRSWPALQRVPVLAICAPASRCNRSGALEAWLGNQERSADSVLEVVHLPGMGHGDIEGAGIGVYCRMCGDDPEAPARDALLVLVDDAMERGLSAIAK